LRILHHASASPRLVWRAAIVILPSTIRRNSLQASSKELLQMKAVSVLLLVTVTFPTF
jgi:hypothetical protein